MQGKWWAVAAAIGGGACLAAARRRSAPLSRAVSPECVEVASEDSFPASDPPGVDRNERIRRELDRATAQRARDTSERTAAARSDGSTGLPM